MKISNSKTAPWESVSIPSGYELNQSGLFKVIDNNKGKENISGPVWISANTQDPVTETHGFIISWLDRLGNLKEAPFYCDILHDHPRKLSQSLAKRGLSIVSKKEAELNQYLSSFNTDIWVDSVSRVGWIENTKGELAYVFPNELDVITNIERNRVIFQPEQYSPSTTSMFQKGSLNDWIKHVAKPCLGNPMLIFSLCAAFAGPLLKHAKAESGGFHFYGRSSTGKTTLIQVAASVYGCGTDPGDAPDHSYIQRWNTTTNAFESLLSAHNDGLITLDEIHTCDVKDFKNVIYNMSGGKGKQAMNKDRDLIKPRSWIVMALSTGEQSTIQKIQEEGSVTSRKNIPSGILLRLINIPTTSNIIVEHYEIGASKFASRLKRVCGNYFGTAAPEFIRQLVTHYEDSYALSHAIRLEVEKYAEELTPEDAEPEQRRAIKRFSLVLASGLWAADFGILPFSKQDIILSIKEVLGSWLLESANLPTSIRGAIAIQDFINCNKARFDSMDPNYSSVKNSVGYIVPDLFLFHKPGFNEACAGFDSIEVAKILRTNNLLKTNEAKRHTYKYDPDKQGRRRFIAVEKRILGFDFTGETKKSNKDHGTGGTNGTIHKIQDVSVR